MLIVHFLSQLSRSEESLGITIGTNCGEMIHGNTAIFCGNSSIKQLISRPLNMSKASILQFALGT